MSQLQVVQRFVLFSLVVLVLASVSLFADDRPEWRTSDDLRPQLSDRRGRFDIEGVVVRVDRNSNDFILRTNRGTVEIEGRYAVPVYFRGRRYQINDLERGDRVAVDLDSSWFGRYRARSVQVLRSVSHRDGDYRRGRRGRYERLWGEVVSVDHRGDSFVVRTERGQNVRVLSRDFRDSRRSIRVGRFVEIEGYYDGRYFVAERIVSGDRDYDDDRYDDRYDR